MMDERSCPCLKSELDIFENTTLQVSTEESSFLQIHPVASINDKGPLEFYQNSSGEFYLDFSHTLLYLQVKIVKNNGSATAATDYVTPVNYLLNTLFSDCSVFLNDKQISSQPNYSYRCYLESLLCTSKATQTSLLSAAFFHKDSANKFNETDPTTSGNEGLKKRFSLSKESKVLDLIGGLHLDLSTQPKLIPNGVDFRVKLQRNKDAFVLMSASEGFKVVIQSACLYVRKVHINPSVWLSHQKVLETTVAKIPIRRVECKAFSISSGISSHCIANAFLGSSPTRLILGFVSNTSYNGDVTKNPFCFEHYNLNHLAVSNGNKSFPSQPLKPNYEQDQYARSYFSLFTDLGRYHYDSTINITYEEYKKGYCLYAFDLTPDFSASESHISVAQNANLTIDFKFARPLSETVTLIAYALYRNTIEIDKARGIFIDY